MSFDADKAGIAFAAALAARQAGPATARAAVADVPGVGPTRGAPLASPGRMSGVQLGKQPMTAQVSGVVARGLMGAPRRG